MEVWKEFDQNPVSHSVAHHLVAIAELHEEFGYARVSDVARALEITRGSASVTLKGLKQRGLVTEDERRFLGLSAEGDRIARSVRAKKKIMKALFIDLLGVDERQADVDTCKIEHLISDRTADRASRFLLFLQEGNAEPLLAEFRHWEKKHSPPAEEFPSAAAERIEPQSQADDEARAE